MNRPSQVPLKFTLDTNCWIDLDEERPSASEVWRLVDAHRKGEANVALVAVSASERQQGGTYLDTYADFESRLMKIGILDLPQILGMAYFDLSYFDRALIAGDEMLRREEEIHSALFPTIDFKFKDYAKTNELEGSDARSSQSKKWRNAWCDRQMFWAHEHARRDVFVTSDSNFKRLEESAGFEGTKIRNPKEAAELVRSS